MAPEWVQRRLVFFRRGGTPQRGQERLKEAAKLGFTQAIVPAANQPKQKIVGMEVHAVNRLDEAIRLFRET